MPASAPAPAGSGPVAEWPLNEGSGTVIHDSTGDGNTGTVYGATWAPGVSGSALSFNGNGNHADINGTPADLTNLSTFTWSAWINVVGEPGRDIGPVIEKGAGSDIRKTFYVGPVGTSDPGLVFARVTTSGAAASSIGVNNSYTVGAWQQWAITYNDSGDRKIHIYRNGVEIAYQSQTAATGTIASDTGYTLSLGATPGSQFYSFNGLIDDVRIYNRVLSAGELSALGEGENIP